MINKCINPGTVKCAIFYTGNENYREIRGNLPIGKLIEVNRKTSNLIVQENKLYELVLQNILYQWKNLPRFVKYLLYLVIATKRVM